MASNLMSAPGHESRGSFESPAGSGTFNPNVIIPGSSPPTPYKGVVDLAPRDVAAGWRVLESAHVHWLSAANPRNPTNEGLKPGEGAHFVDLTADGKGLGILQTIDALPTKRGNRYKLSLELGTLETQTDTCGPVELLVDADGVRHVFKKGRGDELTPSWERHEWEFRAPFDGTTITLAARDTNAERSALRLKPSTYLGIDDVRVTEVEWTFLDAIRALFRRQTWLDVLRTIGRWFVRGR